MFHLDRMNFPVMRALHEIRKKKTQRVPSKGPFCVLEQLNSSSVSPSHLREDRTMAGYHRFMSSLGQIQRFPPIPPDIIVRHSRYGSRLVPDACTQAFHTLPKNNQFKPDTPCITRIFLNHYGHRMSSSNF